MKKIAVLLSFVFLFSLLTTTVSAQNNIPISAEVSETSDGDLKIVFYVQEIKKLMSLRTVIEYDTSVYNLKSAKTSTYTNSYGDEADNIPGMWVFGNLADGTGCVGAFVAMSGVSKTDKTAVCEFVLESKNGKFNMSEIVLSVKELLTDDNNEENDIRTKTIVYFDKPTVDMSGIFGYEIQGEKVSITEFKTSDEVVFVPRYIDGLIVRSVENESICKNPFVVFDRNVLSVGEGVFSSDNTVVAPFGSAPTAAVTKVGGKYLGYYENVIPDLCEKVLYTDTYLVDDSDMVFFCTADFQVQSSHNVLKEYWGTGTVITIKNGENSADFTLCVKGDVNGDSVCDALDTVFAERYVNGLYDLEHIEKKSADFDFDNNVTPQDYTQLVNTALGSEYKLFDGIRGDFNGDYAVDILDVLAFNEKMTNNSLSAEEKAKLDFNNDGIIDSNDRDILNELVMIFI